MRLALVSHNKYWRTLTMDSFAFISLQMKNLPSVYLSNMEFQQNTLEKFVKPIYVIFFFKDT